MNKTVKEKLYELMAPYVAGQHFDILISPNTNMGDYSTNVVFLLAKKTHRKPAEVGKELVQKFRQDQAINNLFQKIEFSKPGFINFYLSDDFLREQLKDISRNKSYGCNAAMKGKTVMVEYTDPNPFKLFHVGHLMSNTIGEAVSRLYEASGAKVIRVTWQGDIGMHIAMAVWAIKTGKAGAVPRDVDSLNEKLNYLSQAYVVGATIYREDGPVAKKEIEEVNRDIYAQNNPEVNRIYNMGRQWSLNYFEDVYKRLGSKFDHYFFESELGQKGLEIVKQHPEIFEESRGAIIFRGEKYGLHTRVFVNSSGLPVYEAKELGLNKEKFDLYNPDLSIIITGNEINEYFKVLLKVMELTMPDVAARSRHISHGMMRLPTGKMSSRTGDVITADSLVEQTKDHLPKPKVPEARLLEEVKEKIAISAIKYSILKQNPGHNIVFDFDKSLSIKGDSAPYLQYTYARLNGILTKASQRPASDTIELKYLTEPVELALIERLLRFPDVVAESVKETAPQHLALYLYELSNDVNRFYELVRVLEDENLERCNVRLVLVETVADVLKRGLSLLGIDTIKRI